MRQSIRAAPQIDKQRVVSVGAFFNGLDQQVGTGGIFPFTGRCHAVAGKPWRDDGFKLVFRREPGSVLKQVRLYFAVMTEYQIDHIGMHFLPLPGGGCRHQPFDTHFVGIEQKTG